MSAFSAFFEFLSLPVEKLLIKIDPHQKHLYERVIDDVYICKTQLRSAFNRKVTKHLTRMQVHPYVEAKL